MAAASGCYSYYKFVSCCDGTELYFCKQQNFSFTGLFVYDGTSYNGGSPIPGTGGEIQPGQCYTISGAATLPPSPGFSYPPLTPAMMADLSSAGGSCSNSICNQCFKKVILHPCCGSAPITFAYDPDYPVSVNNPCQYVGVELVFGVGGVLIPNQCFTIEIANTTEEEANSLPSGPTALSINVAGKTCGDFDPGVVCAPCQYYYQIVNCSNTEETYCTTSYLGDYINNQIENSSLWPVIQVNQFPNKCFYVEQIVTCEAPISITLNSATSISYGCEACQETLTVYYELINCNNSSIIVYTSTDLHEYIGDYITLEEYAGQCFYVSITESLVPSDITVTPTGDLFATCQECSLPRYILEDCSEVAEPIITQTDLSSYVGSVITLQTCPDICWYVSETDLTTSSSPVYIETPYIDCAACYLATRKCKCATITNNTTNPVNTSYIDCVTGSATRAGNIQPGETSEKRCVLGFTSIYGIVTEYGDCTINDDPLCYNYAITTVPFDGIAIVHYKDCTGTEVTRQIESAGKTGVEIIVCGVPQTINDVYIIPEVPFTLTEGIECSQPTVECPTPPVHPKPQRKVTPGYDTPACTAEYYEKVECNFSEWMYKDVLEKRYGISNCCPEELMKWEIKHEMLMLDALVNPDYNCLPTNSCGCTTIVPYQPCIPTPPITYNCVNYTCIPVTDGTGQYASLTECQNTCIPPVVSYNCIETPTCIQYNCTIYPGQDINPGTFYYKDCIGTFQQVSIPYGKYPIYLAICSIPNATSADIYVTENVDGLEFVETSTICESTTICTEIQGTSGTYPTLSDCQTYCGNPVYTPCAECIKITFIPVGGSPIVISMSATGTGLNGTPYYNFIYSGVTYEIYNSTYNEQGAELGIWYLNSNDIGDDIGVYGAANDCPYGTYNMIDQSVIQSLVIEPCVAVAS